LILDWARRFEIGTSFPVLSLERRPVRRRHLSRGRRLDRTVHASSGRYVKSRLPQGRPRSIALDATLRAAAGRRSHPVLPASSGIRVATQDIREKIRVQPSAAAILFLVDASGSMGANRRMVLTKGIIFSLITDAYRKRDQMALLAFRATQTELLLPFTRSPLVARRQLRNLAVGGKTPLGLGLREAAILLERQRLRYPQLRPLLVVVSDGKGNVALEYGDPYDEAIHYARLVRRKGIDSIFLDTEEDPCLFGYGRQIARVMGGRYLSAEDIRGRGVVELPL
jgi:magnesium chelatase subunit D